MHSFKAFFNFVIFHLSDGLAGSKCRISRALERIHSVCGSGVCTVSFISPHRIHNKTVLWFFIGHVSEAKFRLVVYEKLFPPPTAVSALLPQPAPRSDPHDGRCSSEGTGEAG